VLASTKGTERSSKTLFAFSAFPSPVTGSGGFGLCRFRSLTQCAQSLRLSSLISSATRLLGDLGSSMKRHSSALLTAYRFDCRVSKHVPSFYCADWRLFSRGRGVSLAGSTVLRGERWRSTHANHLADRRAQHLQHFPPKGNVNYGYITR